MDKDRKKLLVTDLCGRLPYMPKCKFDLAGYLEWNEEYKKLFDNYARVVDNAFANISDKVYTLYSYVCSDRFEFLDLEESTGYGIPIEYIKPYLRPLKAMNDVYDKIGGGETNLLTEYVKYKFEKDEYLHKVYEISRIKRFDRYVVVYVKYKLDNTHAESAYGQIHPSDALTWIGGIDWLNENHFDYRDLIKKGLALDGSKVYTKYDTWGKM